MLSFIWIAVLSGVALWSLLGWGLFRLLAIDQGWLGELQPVIDRVPFGHWLDHWLPGWRALVELAIDAVQLALGALGEAAPIVVWVVWGVGTLVLVGGGALLSLAVVLLRDKPQAGPAR
jgi:hypothetical protein